MFGQERLDTLYNRLDNNPSLTPLYNAEIALENAGELPLPIMIDRLDKEIAGLEQFHPNIRKKGLSGNKRCFQNVQNALSILHAMNSK